MNTSLWNRIYTPLIIALVFVIGMSVGRQFLTNSTFIGNKNSSKLERILRYIENDYVDTVNVTEIENQAIEKMIDDLDPHSSYIMPDNFHSFMDPLLGNFEGIGIQFRMIRDTLTVMMPIIDGPSYKVGIEAGDKIVIAAEDTIAGQEMSSNEIIKKLKGERGSNLQLKIYRSGIDSLLTFDVVRDVIPIYSLDAKFMIDDSIGYIKISKFSATTIDEFDDAIESLLQEGMGKLILDLRGNTGGYLKAAIAMADTFLEDGKLIVYTSGKNRPEKKHFAKAHGAFEKQDVVVLIDENSASASEIVAGAIQDNDRGQIIGRRSFGKGLVQEQLNFSDGSAVRLTVARYYTPTGRCIQRSYTNGTEAYYADHYHRMIDDLNIKNDSIADSLKFITPKGKIVYGGGGILPDVVIAIDTNINYYLYNQLLRKSTVVEFAIDYYNKNREDFGNYNHVADFYENYSINHLVYTELIKKAKQQGIKPTNKEVKNSEKLVMNAFEAELARLIFGDKAYYYIYLQEDEVFKQTKALLDK